MRLQRIQQLLGMPALDEQGQPITNPQTGQPMPGRVARIYQNNPDVKALVDDTMKNEWFLATQQNPLLKSVPRLERPFSSVPRSPSTSPPNHP